MAILKVDTISGIGTEGPVFEGDIEFTSQNFLTLPKGDTTQRISTSSGISTETGAVRYNTDSNKMECYIGSTWMEVAVSSPNLDGGTRGIISGGYFTSSPNATNNIQFITVETQGNALDFGDLTAITHNGGALSSSTRYCHTGGVRAGSNSNIIDFVTVSSTGNAQDFGDMTGNLYQGTSTGNATRGIIYTDAGTPSGDHFLDFITIASTGNAVRFGEIFGQNGARQNCGSFASPTRALIGGGGFPNVLSGIDFITIPTQGDSQDFGDLNVAARSQAGCSNSTRGVFSGGGPPSSINVMESVQIATLGNAVNYGDLTAAQGGKGAGLSNKTRGVWGNYEVSRNVLSYFSLVTAGETIDFGDSVASYSDERGASNGHGGL